MNPIFLNKFLEALGLAMERSPTPLTEPGKNPDAAALELMNRIVKPRPMPGIFVTDDVELMLLNEPAEVFRAFGEFEQRQIREMNEKQQRWIEEKQKKMTY